MISLLLFRRIAAMFIMMSLGFVFVKSGKAKSEDSTILSKVCIYLVTPFVIINAFQIDYTPAIRDGFFLALLAALILHAMLFLLFDFGGRLLHLRTIERNSIIYSNAANLIIPLVIAVLGSEWVIYSSAFIMVQTVFVWTHAVTTMQDGGKFAIKKIFTNINIWAIAVGLLFFFCGIRLPEIVADAVSSLAGMIAPLSMVMLGMIFAKTNLRATFCTPRIYVVVVLKMLVSPLLCLCILKFTPLQGMIPQAQTVLYITLLAACSPTATVMTQLAQTFDAEPQYAGAINLLTTLVCIGTMPLMTALYYM